MRTLPAILFILAAPCLHAHSVHTSTAEVEYNPQTKKLEVSLIIFINDLELALIRQSERELRIDKTPAAEFDAQIQAYLAKTFVVTDAAGKAAKMEWVGREMDKESEKGGDPAVVLFFDVEVPEGMKGAKLCNAVCCELFEDQSNLMQLREGARRGEMRFVRGDAAKLLIHPEK